MTRVLAMAALTILLTFSATPAYTQPLPDGLRSAGVTQAQWNAIRREARVAAARANIAEATLLAAAEREGLDLLRSSQFDPTELGEVIMSRLETQAQAIRQLEGRLELTRRIFAMLEADWPELGLLSAQAREQFEAEAEPFLIEAGVAIADGRLADADVALGTLEQLDLAAIASQEMRAMLARERMAGSIADGIVAGTQGDVDPAHWRRMVELFQSFQADLKRERSPQYWTLTQFELGVAYAMLAQSGDDEARVLAIGALQAASSGFKELQNAESQTRAERLIAALQVH